MLIVAATLIGLAWIVSSESVQRMIPSESVVAAAVAGVAMAVLVYTGSF